MAGSKVFVILLSFACVSSHLQKNAEVTYLKDLLPNGHSQYHVTDGRVFMEAMVSPDDLLQECEMTFDPASISHLQRNHYATKLSIDNTGLAAMIHTCEMKPLLRKKRQSNSGNGSGRVKTTPFAPEKTGKPSGPMGSFAIFPGTKWCGLDNKAASYDDLGEHRDTDLCCRTHDHCPYYIDHFETKFNYRNPYPWTLSYCHCDNALYNCLKAVKTKASNEVGKLFFGVLDVKCFDFEKGKYCAEAKFEGLWCEKEAYGEKAVAKPFPHHWSDDSDNLTENAGLVG